MDDEERIERERAAMAATITAEVAETSHWLGKDSLDEAVMDAMARVPRHAFVPDQRRAVAYENRPQQIGYGQTISQPYIVAVMTDLAAPGPDRKILEVGTGCGYQAAVLAETGARVYSIEVVPELARESAARLARLGYDAIEVRHGDGAQGWPEQAPFDAIVVTAAAFRRVPPALLEQLAPGGRLAIPVERSASRFRLFGSAGEQELLLVTKDEDGNVSERCMLPVAFVPLVEGRARPG
ncbi:MAG: protein-L-isoaspartate(D-aspartate) O-methyltransferase [Kiloniellales bacterium]